MPRNPYMVVLMFLTFFVMSPGLVFGDLEHSDGWRGRGPGDYGKDRRPHRTTPRINFSLGHIWFCPQRRFWAKPLISDATITLKKASAETAV